MSKHDSYRNLFSPTTAPLPMVFKKSTSPGPSLAPPDYPGSRRAKKWKGPNLAFISKRHLKKEAPSSVLINYLWRYNYSEYGISFAASSGDVVNYKISAFYPP